MVDIAEMMLDGTLCEGCGTTNRKGGLGFPWRCAGCKDDAPARRRKTPAAQYTKLACPTCGRRVKRVGLADHMKTHGEPTMLSTSKMIQQFEGLIGTEDLSVWEAEFVQKLADINRSGEVTKLTGNQVDKLDELYRRHFA